MPSSFLFRFFLKAYRKEILREAYIGILGREPDAAGLDAHAASIEQRGELAPVLKEISNSDEAWRCAVKSHSESIVSQLHVALRDGEGHPEDLVTWGEHLGATGNVGAAAASVAKGPEHWKRLVREDPSTLIDAAFNGLLQRQPDLDGIATYTKLLAHTGDMREFLAALSDSEEHRVRLLAQLDRSTIAGPTRLTTSPISPETLVIAAYRGLLGREPDADGLATYTRMIEEGGNLDEFLAGLDQSPEHRKRILLRRN